MGTSLIAAALYVEKGPRDRRPSRRLGAWWGCGRDGRMLSGVVQQRLVRSLLLALDRPADTESVEMLLWFFSKRTLYPNLVAYATAVQAVLTYALGQLVIRCAIEDDGDPKTRKSARCGGTNPRGHLLGREGR